MVVSNVQFIRQSLNVSVLSHGVLRGQFLPYAPAIASARMSRVSHVGKAGTVCFSIFSRDAVSYYGYCNQAVHVVCLSIFRFRIARAASQCHPRFRTANAQASRAILSGRILARTIHVVQFGTGHVVHHVSGEIFRRGTIAICRVSAIVVPVKFTVRISSISVGVLALIMYLIPTYQIPRNSVLSYRVLTFARVSILQAIHLIQATRFR